MIRFVADFRVDIHDSGIDIDPTIAEVLIRAVLTEQGGLVDDLDPGTVVEAEMLLLWKLLSRLTDAELTRFLEDSDALAVRWEAAR